MIEPRKKYIIYFWTRDAIIQYGQDYSNTGEDVDEEFYIALESNQRSIIDYGEVLGEYMNEDEALKALSDFTDNKLRQGLNEISIWDVDNHRWFN